MPELGATCRSWSFEGAPEKLIQNKCLTFCWVQLETVVQAVCGCERPFSTFPAESLLGFSQLPDVEGTFRLPEATLVFLLCSPTAIAGQGWLRSY